ncbi:MAG TPA: ketopantoate reductase C-terminal domain-containing protein [Thermoleophilia bacterium]|nr:ketopantoate reductase C-terminal domain-containing protein [Thermoleophilia bacterium]
MQRDVEAGRRHEGDVFGGAIARLDERHGLDTPSTRQVHARLSRPPSPRRFPGAGPVK